MTEYLHPGVYVTEVAFDAKPIEGVSTSTSAIIGPIVAEARRLLGPLAPDWTEPNDRDPGIALLELLAWLGESLVYRGDPLPERGVLHASRLAAAALALVADREQPCGGVLKRVRFFEGRLLDADDLTAEQDYVRRRIERHNRELHRQGIVRGLEVCVNNDSGGPSTVVVTPGYAIDSHGREIVLERELALPLSATFSCAFVIARRKREVPRWIALESSSECEFLIVNTPADDDFSLARLETTATGWQVARTEI
jgi:hypothetical protein